MSDSAAMQGVQELERELQHGTPRLRFADAEMEGSFRADFKDMAPNARRTVLLVPLVMFVLGPLYGSSTFYVPDVLVPLLRTVEFGIIAPFTSLALVLISVPRLAAYADAVMMGTLIVVGTCLELLAEVGPPVGFEFPEALPSLAIMAVYLVCRLTLLRAISTVVVMLLLFGWFDFVLSGHPQYDVFDFISHWTFALLGAAGAYRYEVSMRKSWLQNRLLEALVRHDPLTGVLNRRGYDLDATRILRQAQRSGQGIGLMMVDIDHFKRLNDHHGHDYGDECLKKIGALLAAQVRRPNDLCARIGGEEFILIWSDVSPEAARRLCERCHASIGEAALRNEGLPNSETVTVSAGAIHFIPRPSFDLHTAQVAADTLLYRAKMDGRNSLRFNVMVPETAPASP